MADMRCWLDPVAAVLTSCLSSHLCPIIRIMAVQKVIHFCTTIIRTHANPPSLLCKSICVCVCVCVCLVRSGWCCCYVLQGSRYRITIQDLLSGSFPYHSKSKLLYDWRSDSQYIRAPLWGPWPYLNFPLILSENCFALCLGAPSLTRARVNNL
jgi:hypothetical protein